MPTHEDWMRLALAEAERGAGRTTPNPHVGCIIVRRGKMLARGFTQPAGKSHAELVALGRLRGHAAGADVYVTLEPCNHVGRTGPCAEALIEAGVGRVFVAMRDPNPHVRGGGIERLRRAGVKVEVGLLETEARRQNQAFAHYITRGRPYVVAKLAQSLDGRVATRQGESKWITSEQARAAGHALRNVCDAVLVGVGTVLADDPELTCRMRGGRDPLRVVLDSDARTPPGAKVVRVARRSAAATVIMVGKGAPPARLARLRRAGAEVVVARRRAGRIDVADLLKILGQRELMALLVEGGPTVLGAFFDARLVNEVHAFVAPRIIGGEAALGSVGGLGAGKLVDAATLQDVQVKHVGPDLWVTGSLRQ